MNNPPVALIGRGDVVRALPLGRSLELAAIAYRATATGAALDSSLGHLLADGGEFHIKGSGLTLDGRLFVAVKVGACYYQRPVTLGLPSIVGLIELFDGITGQPLAVMESALVTKLRTAAGTAVALDHLARPDADRLAIFGAGEQMAPHVEAIAAVRRLRSVTLWARHAEKAEAAVTDLRLRFPLLPVSVALEPSAAARDADLIVCLTPAASPYLTAADVRAGSTIAAVGSDAPNKRELALDLLSAAVIVCDVTHQCARVGELHHALDAGTMALSDVRSEIGQVVAGLETGRRSDDEIVVFDSTGTAVQDAAAAAAVYLATSDSPNRTTVDLWAP